MFICGISIIILICRKLGPIGPVQQQIKLPSPKGLKMYLLLRVCFGRNGHVD